MVSAASQAYSGNLFLAHIIKMFLTTLVTELAFDTSSSPVRVAVFQPLLSNLQDLVHDQAEKVRVAFLDVLLLVKGLKAIKYWNIVPLEQLLAQLEVEQSASVIRRLVKTASQFISSTTKGLMYRKFYQYVHLHTTVSATGSLMGVSSGKLSLVKLCKARVEVMIAAMSLETDSQAEDKENTDKHGNLDSCDTSSLAGMAETVAICWGEYQGQTRQAFKHPRIQAACLVIAGFLPSSSIARFSAKCLSSLSTLPSSTLDTEYSPLLNCLCAWDRVTDVLELINEWITSGMSGTTRDTRMGEKQGQERNL
ncbi:Condensin-2 complex subunit G2 [Desmophyllum pertusum]|uniref:Condensin-2 complex subunit G2 n=1 Tax=Desmophyllum pertusum TaxID=174260 RepID=A0A9X0CM46_9CNID|nr:Condensin-2 complex subunit G2 [Desmophyllum pertusum]